MSSKRAYAGNTRLIEIGAGEMPFRILLNLDKVENIRFEETREERDFPVPGTGVEAFTDDDGREWPEIKPEMRKQIVGTGFAVIIQQGGQPAQLSFPGPEQAMSCYNHIINMIKSVGVPTVTMNPLHMTKPESPIVGVDGEAIADAVDAADLHGDLAGGEGDGMAENDDGDFLEDEDFEITEEDIERLDALGVEDPPADN